MSRRNWTALSAVVLVFAISQVATAQVNPKGAAPGNQAGDAALAAPPGGATWQDVIVELRELRSEMQTLQSNVGALQQNMVAMQDGFEKQMEINDKLDKQFNELSDKVNQIVVGGAGSVASLRPNMDDPQQAKEFQKVIQGKVIFDNQTGEAQRIFINGAEWEVITGRSSMLVPYGQVTFHTRATNDGTLTQFNADNWTKVGEQLVLNVPLQPTPEGDR